MKHDHHPSTTSAGLNQAAENGSEIRAFAGWMGLVIIAFGVAVAGYLLLRIGEVVIDPRGFETQVDRWEFVVRGRVSDALPDAYETPERTIPAAVAPAEPVPETEGTAGTAGARPSAPDGQVGDVEKMAEFVGRVSSKSARPAALFLLVIIITIIVRIIIAIINAGIRLVYVTAGEKEYMKRIIEELVDQRRQ